MIQYLKRAKWLLIAFTLTVLFAGRSISSNAQDSCAGCDLAREAIEASRKLKAGMTRGDLEKEFDTDGGISFQGKGTYVYRKCRYMKIDAEFERHAVPAGALRFSADDKMLNISKPYIAYPVSD